MSKSRSPSNKAVRPVSSRQRSEKSERRLSRAVSGPYFDDYHVYTDGDWSDDESSARQEPEPSHLFSRSNSGEERGPSEEASDEKDRKEEYENSTESSDCASQEKDVEAQKDLEKTQSRRSSKPKDPNLVTWDGPEDPQNPKNWTLKQKWFATFVVSGFTFMSPTTSSAIAPALTSMSEELGITNSAVTQLTLSIFVLAYGFGPFMWGPLSEIFGRIPILQISNLMFLAFNLGCGFAKTTVQMIIFRFLAGIGGSAPLSLGGGLLSDCWHPDQRGKAMGIYSLAPLVGPAIGPIAGAWIVQETTWRWIFWATTIADALVQIIGVFFLRETYAPALLQRKAKRLRKETGNDKLYTEHDDPEQTLLKKIRGAVYRPFRLLFTQPIIQSIAVYMGYLYGLMYLMVSTFPLVWEGQYGESTGIAGLNFISLGIGFSLGAQIAAPINDRIYRRLRLRNGGVGKPEYRVPNMFVGTALIPVGLFWYGWAAEAKTHWIVPNIGAAIFAAGAMVNFQCMQTYVIDGYARYAASGLAAVVVLRSLAGCGFPLFAPAMYDGLGFGWGNSVLGLAGILLGVPAPFVFWFYGERLRARSTYAAGD